MIQAIIILAANFILLFFIYKILDRKIKNRLAANKLLQEVRSEVELMVLELNQVTDRNVGLLEERISRLSKLLGEADRKIVTLSKEGEKYSLGGATYNQLRPKSRNPVEQTTEPSDPAKQLFFPEKPEESKTPPEADKPSKIEETPENLADVRGEVMRLYKEGIDKRIIASKLKKTMGEIELIISWEERKG